MNAVNLQSVIKAHFLEYLPKLAGGIISLFIFLAIALVGRRIISRILFRLNVDKVIIRLITQLFFYTTITIGIVTGFGTMGVNISAIVAGLGLGGFAVGFALRDAISNLMAGILILLYRPFQTGQIISVAGFQGRITEINLRYTVLKSDSEIYLIPNSMIFTNPVKVLQ